MLGLLSFQPRDLTKSDSQSGNVFLSQVIIRSAGDTLLSSVLFPSSSHDEK